MRCFYGIQNGKNKYATMSNLLIYTNYDFYIILDYVKEGQHLGYACASHEDNHTKKTFDFSIIKYNTDALTNSLHINSVLNKNTYSYNLKINNGQTSGNIMADTCQTKSYIRSYLENSRYEIHPVVTVDFLSYIDPNMANEYFKYIDENQIFTKDETIKNMQKENEHNIELIKNQDQIIKTTNEKIEMLDNKCDELSKEIIKKDLIIDKLTFRINSVENKYKLLIEQTNE